MWSFFVLYSTTSISTSTAVMKTYELGSVGDRNVTVKKIGGEYVVTIRVKDAELKNVQLPPKGKFFYIEYSIFLLAEYPLHCLCLTLFFPSYIVCLILFFRVTDGRLYVNASTTSMSRPCEKVATSSCSTTLAARTT